jgi:hypothetical protein
MIGRHARIVDGIVFIFGHDGDCYQGVRTDREDVSEYQASELTVWKPKPGEHVVESGNESSHGIVVEAGDEISLVRFGGLLRQVCFVNKVLEPAWAS